MPAVAEEDVLRTATLEWLERRDRLDGGRLAGPTAPVIGVELAEAGIVRPQTVDPLAAGALRGWDGRGALVLAVCPGSPATAAGLMPGDVVVSFADLWVDDAADLARLIARARSGREYPVGVLRDGEVEVAWLSPIARRTLSTDDRRLVRWR